MRGQGSVINSKYNAYAFSVTYSACQGPAAVLNGQAATGIGALNDSVNPHLLYLGYSVTLQNGTTIIAVGDATESSSPAGELLSITVTPTDISLPVGATQQFKAIGTYSDSSTTDLTTSAQWTSSVPTVAALNATNGVATGLNPGATTVTATSGSISGTAILNVSPTALVSIAITPNPFSTGIGIERQLTATGTYLDTHFKHYNKRNVEYFRLVNCNCQ